MRIWVAIPLSLCLASGAYAQETIRDVQREIERFQERERERLRESEQTFEQSQIAPPKGTSDDSEDDVGGNSDPCRAIARVEITGMTRYDPQRFLSDTAGLIGSCVSTMAVTQLRRKITNTYVRDGYITSQAFVSPKPSAPDVLTIRVVEGRIDTITSVAAKGRSYTAAERDLAFPGITGKLLNLRDLEQGVDQLARMASADPTIDIVPSEVPEASTIQVRRTRVASWIRPAISVNNDGAALTGRRLATASLDIDSPLGIADVWSLYYLTDIERAPVRGVEAFGGFVSLPYGATTIIVSANRYRSRSVLRNADLAFLNSNASISGSAGLTNLIYRDRNTKVSIAATFSIYNTVSRIQSIRLSTNSYRVISAELGLRVQRRIGNDLLFGELAFSQGFDVLGANAADTGPGSDGVRASRITANLSYQAGFDVFGARARYLASLRGQVGLNTVLPVDRLSIGGSSTVRGFRDDGISGRTGYVLRQQVTIDLLRTFTERSTGRATQISMFAAYDQGGIAPRQGDRFERGFLHSATAGLRLQNRRLLGEISVAAPLSAPITVQRKRIEFAVSARITI